MTNQKYQRFQRFEPQQQPQPQPQMPGQQRNPASGWGSYPPQAQMPYNPMMGQMGYGYPPQYPMAQAYGYQPFPSQQQQNYQGRSQANQFGRQPGLQQPGVTTFPFQNANANFASTDKPAIAISTPADLKAKKAEFSKLPVEQKKVIYRTLILQKLNEIPQIVKM